MAEYSYKDVIIDPDDPRVEIGAEYYRADYPKKVVRRANDDSHDALGTLVGIDAISPETPFIIANAGYGSLSWACLIRKKETKKKYAPFDLSKPEVRDKLREKWIKAKHGMFELEINIFRQSGEEVLE